MTSDGWIALALIIIGLVLSIAAALDGNT